MWKVSIHPEEVFVIGAIGPEAEVNPKRWRKAIRDAERRLDEIEE